MKNVGKWDIHCICVIEVVQLEGLKLSRTSITITVKYQIYARFHLFSIMIFSRLKEYYCNSVDVSNSKHCLSQVDGKINFL